MNESSLKTEAIVLRRTNFSEADRVLQFITPNNGKLGVMARGVRKEKSKLAGGIELFAVCDVVIHLGKGDLGTLTSVRLNVFYSHILEDYDRMQFGYQVLRQVAKFADDMQEPEFYTITKTALASLNNLKIDLRVVQAWFYIHLAEVIGHGLNVSRDNQNRPLAEDKKYRFDIAEMSFIEDEKGAFDANHLKLLKLLQHKDPDIIAKIGGIEQLLDDCLSIAHAASE
ncbi:DNA repair protein RecO [Candidatus Saccharibacteria bacterium]|nr:DNA repair protein RecO [Candidatus Saccharibacteria bacterium]